MILKVVDPAEASRRRVRKLPGVVGVEVNVVQATVKVGYDPAFVSEARIRQACRPESPTRFSSGKHTKPTIGKISYK